MTGPTPTAPAVPAATWIPLARPERVSGPVWSAGMRGAIGGVRALTTWSWVCLAVIVAGMVLVLGLARADDRRPAGLGSVITPTGQQRPATATTRVLRQMPHGPRIGAEARCADFILGYAREHPDYTRAEVVARNADCAAASARSADDSDPD